MHGPYQRGEASEARLDGLKNLLVEAGRLALDHRERGLQISTKENGAPVTSADRAVDAYLFDALRAEFPEDCILTEERPDDPERLSAHQVWIVDPIDGTAAFLAGNDAWGVLLARCDGGVATVGAAHFPELHLTLVAERGGACRLNGRPVHVSQTPPERSRITRVGERFTGIWPREHRGRFPALELTCLIAGEFEGIVIQAGSSCGEHDYAWAACAIEAAGGVMTDGTGESLRFNRPDRTMPPVIVASNGLLHDALLDALAAL